jgi:hypothetical protein
VAEKAHSSSGSDSSNRFILCAYIKHGETNYRYRKAHFHTCPKKPLKLVAKALDRPLSNTQTCQNRPGVSKNILCGSIIGHHATPGEAFAEAVLTQHCAPAWSSRDWYRQKGLEHTAMPSGKSYYHRRRGIAKREEESSRPCSTTTHSSVERASLPPGDT